MGTGSPLGGENDLGLDRGGWGTTVWVNWIVHFKMVSFRDCPGCPVKTVSFHCSGHNAGLISDWELRPRMPCCEAKKSFQKSLFPIIWFLLQKKFQILKKKKNKATFPLPIHKGRLSISYLPASFKNWLLNSTSPFIFNFLLAEKSVQVSPT